MRHPQQGGLAQARRDPSGTVPCPAGKHRQAKVPQHRIPRPKALATGAESPGPCMTAHPLHAARASPPQQPQHQLFKAHAASPRSPAVQASKSAVWKYTLDSYSRSPMEPPTTPMTSAAMPDFHDMPRATLHPDRRNGFTWGTIDIPQPPRKGHPVQPGHLQQRRVGGCGCRWSVLE